MIKEDYFQYFVLWSIYCVYDIGFIIFNKKKIKTKPKNLKEDVNYEEKQKKMVIRMGDNHIDNI